MDDRSPGADNAAPPQGSQAEALRATLDAMRITATAPTHCRRDIKLIAVSESRLTTDSSKRRRTILRSVGRIVVGSPEVAKLLRSGGPTRQAADEKEFHGLSRRKECGSAVIVSLS